MKIIRIILWILGLGMLIAVPIQYCRYFANTSTDQTGFLVIALSLVIFCLCCAASLRFIRWKNAELKLISHVACLIICLLVISVYGFISFVFEGIHNAMEPVTDVGQYENILAEWKRSAPHIVEHFPEAILTEAQDVRFYFSPGLQADSIILLGFQVPEEQFQEYKNRFSSMVTKTYRGDLWTRVLSIYNETERAELSKGFVVMQFDKDPNTIYEHGKEHGVAINENVNEIIFWAEW